MAFREAHPQVAVSVQWVGAIPGLVDRRAETTIADRQWVSAAALMAGRVPAADSGPSRLRHALTIDDHPTDNVPDPKASAREASNHDESPC
jgi:hypothetical protein